MPCASFSVIVFELYPTTSWLVMYVVPPLMTSFEVGTKSGVVVLKPFFTPTPNQPQNHTVPASTRNVASFSCAFAALSVGSTVFAPTIAKSGGFSVVTLGLRDQLPPPNTSVPSATVSLAKPTVGASPLACRSSVW